MWTAMTVNADPSKELQGHRSPRVITGDQAACDPPSRAFGCRTLRIPHLDPSARLSGAARFVDARPTRSSIFASKGSASSALAKNCDVPR